jgi:hypothetical protein
MRYADGGGLTVQGRSRREQARLQAAEMFAQDADARQVARALRVSTKSVYLSSLRIALGVNARFSLPAAWDQGRSAWPWLGTKSPSVTGPWCMPASLSRESTGRRPSGPWPGSWEGGQAYADELPFI